MSSPPVDPRRQDKVRSFKASANGQTEDFLPDYFNILGMVFSMCGLMMKLKWCAWLALYCKYKTELWNVHHPRVVGNNVIVFL